MKINFSLSNLRKSHEIPYFVVDILMLGLLTLNLAFIIFDWFFMNQFVKDFFRQQMPSFFYVYSHIHENFFLYDLIFVTVFIAEFTVRWIINIRRDTYHSWYFYPFLHWYDVIGCIPIGSFRVLRVLRVFSILYRLQKYNVIDLSESPPIKFVRKYFNVLMEEITDRVTVNMLRGIQYEIKRGNPLVEQIIDEVLMPNKIILVEVLSHRVQKIAANAHGIYGDEIERYLDELIGRAIQENRHISNLERIPAFGGFIIRNLEEALSDIVFKVVNTAIEDLASLRSRTVVSNITDIAFDAVLFEERDKKLNETAREIAIRSIDLIIEQVKVQQWKVRDLEEREARLQAKLKKAQQTAARHS